MDTAIRSIVELLYGFGAAPLITRRILDAVERRAAALERAGLRLSASQSPRPGTELRLLDERDAFVIAYGDQFRESGRPPLATLHDFARHYLSGLVSGIHLLPFFPSTSDDGFAVSDYGEVDPALGTWHDVEAIGTTFGLMFDLVLNHCSASHPWFRRFLDGDARYRDYFITIESGVDLSRVVRPRALPLLTPFDTPEGRRLVWTTFGADQIDLNYANPEVLLEMLGVLFDYVARGARVIRLDAVAYLWKEPGHPCIHHPKTHAVVRLMRALVDRFAPWVVILTETNVPHRDNLSYLGDGTDEAHMVYQFALPPLVLDAFRRADAGHLRDWCAALERPSATTTFFNFLASHDGIGLLPAAGILSEGEIDGIVREVTGRGGLVSHRATPDGPRPYELNVTYLDAIAETELEPALRARKFLASQAILLSLVGVPGIYINSLIGSGNWLEGVHRTGHNRAINREKLDYAATCRRLDGGDQVRSEIYGGYAKMLRARKRAAFHPYGRQRCLPADQSLFVLLRESPDGRDRVLCIVNTGGTRASHAAPAGFDFDLISRRRVVPGASSSPAASVTIELEPWQALWLSSDHS